MNKINFSSFLNRCKQMLTRNLALKITALVFALLLWAYVLVVLDPIRSKVVDDVPITLEGYNDLLSRNLILVDSKLGTADITVDSKITEHANLNPSRISCRASLSTINDAGVFQLPVSAYVQSSSGSISKVSPATVQVEVDRLIKKNLPVRVELEGKLPEGFEVLSQSYNTNITIEGASRFVESAVRAVAKIDLSNRSKPINEIVSLVFYDAQENQVEVITRTGDTPSMLVLVDISAYKRVPVQLNINIAEPDYYSFEAVSSLEEITLYGDKALLDTIESVTTLPLLLNAETGIQQLNGELVIPEGVVIRPATANRIRVSATVEEIVSEKLLEVPIQYVQLGEGLQLKEGAPATVELKVRGTVRQLEMIGAENISVTLSLAGRAVGVHEIAPLLKLQYTEGFDNVTLTLSKPTVKVELESTKPEA